MPTFTVPSSYGTFREFNSCHGPADGKFCSDTARVGQRVYDTEQRQAGFVAQRGKKDGEAVGEGAVVVTDDGKAATYDADRWTTKGSVAKARRETHWAAHPEDKPAPREPVADRFGRGMSPAIQAALAPFKGKLKHLTLTVQTVTDPSHAELHTLYFEHGKIELLKDLGPHGDADHLMVMIYAVDRGHQKQGLGETLLRAGHAYAKAAGYKGIYSYPDDRTVAGNRGWAKIPTTRRTERALRLEGYGPGHVDFWERRIRESNDCHSPADGKFCSAPGAGEKRKPRPGRRRGGADYSIVFRSELNKGIVGRHYVTRELEEMLTSAQQHKFMSARVMLTFHGYSSAHLGAPVVWTAPNGVQVVYKRGQRRGGTGGHGTYHDFDVAADELVVPLTRNVGSGRRALRAWAAVHTADVTTLRFRARQLVRDGD